MRVDPIGSNIKSYNISKLYPNSRMPEPKRFGSENVKGAETSVSGSNFKLAMMPIKPKIFVLR